MKLVRIFTLVALTVALLAGCGGNKDSDGTPRTSDGDRETSAPVKSAHAEDGQDYSAVNPDTLTSDQFYDDLIYPETYRVSWASKTLDQKTTPEVVSQMNALLRSDGRDQLGTIVPASPDNTGNEILARQSLATYIASTEPDPERGRKLLAAAVSPENPGFTDLMAQLGARQKPIAALYQVPINTSGQSLETPTFTETTVANYKPNSTPSKLMTIYNQFNNEYRQITVKYVGGTWLTVNTIDKDNSNWIIYPERLDVK